MTWKDDQEWERKWHDNCVNSYWEETKQIVYAKRMGLGAQSELGKYPIYNLDGKSVLDIGAGPYSMLLKTKNGGDLTALDPCDYPNWTKERYKAHGIKFLNMAAEKINTVARKYDEVWIYNCLQHTINPEEIIKKARKVSRVIRIFEWIDAGVTVGHPQDLKEELLNKWLGGVGKVEQMAESGCYGKAYYGIFKGDQYEVSPLGASPSTTK